MSEERSDKWELPEPVFRQSEGEPVKPVGDAPADPEPDTLEPNFSEDVTAVPDRNKVELELPADPLANLYTPPEAAADSAPAQAPAAPAVDVEPQPFISEEFTAERIVVEDPKLKKKPRSALKTAFLAILFLILLGVAGAIVVAVYIFYFAGRSSSGGF